MLAALFHGIILAFGLILPLGVQNVFIFNQGATHRKFSRALPAVVTAGICDMLLILLAVMGVSLIVFSFAWLKNLIFLVGFFFMVYMGWSIFKSAPGTGKGRREALSPKQQILFAASVSLLNPHAIMDLIGVIGPSSLAYEGEQLVVFTVACISVSFLWFFGLAIAGRLIGGFDSDGKIIRRLNQISAFIIWGIAVYLGIQLVESL